MIIRTLRLENIKSYTNASFTFSEGVNAIVGRNGAGKSTIVESIGYTLFDAGKGSALTRQGANSGQITVGFDSLDGRRYNVVRRTAQAIWYVHDAELNSRLCTGAADVTAFLREEMGLSRTVDLEKVFDDAVGVAQGSVTDVFRRTHSQRKTVFDPLLEVDEYDTAFANLLESRNHLRDEQGKVETAHARLSGILEKLPEVETNLERVRHELANVEAALVGAAQRQEEATRERIIWDDRRRAVESARAQHEKATYAVERAQVMRDAALQALDEAKHAQTIVAQNQQGHDAHLAAREERKRLDALGQQRQRLLLEQSQVAAARNNAQTEITRAEAELEEIAVNELLAQQLESAVQQEAALQSQLDAARRDQQQIAQQQSALQRLQSTLAQESARLNGLRSDAATAKSLQEQVARAQSTEDEKRIAIESISVEMSTTKMLGESAKTQSAALKGAGALCPVCEQPLAANHQHALVERNDAKVVALRDEWVALNKQRTEAEEARTALQKEIKQLTTTLGNLPSQSTIDQAQRYVDELQTQQKHVEETIASLQTSAARLPALEQQIGELGEPRVRRGVALQVAGRRPVVEKTLAASNRTMTSAVQRTREIETDLVQFTTLDDDLHTATHNEQATQTAWQQVIAFQPSAAQLPLRQEAANTGEANLAKCVAAVEKSAATCSTVESSWNAETADAARDREADARAEAVSLASRVELHRSEAQRLEEERSALLKQRDEQTTLRHKMDAIKRQQEVLDAMRAAIKAAGPQITRALIGQVGAYAAQWFSELTGDFTRRLKWDQEYAIVLEENGRELDFKALSGGEQMAAALSVRLALLRELGKVDLAFFDEPTAHLDIDRREALAKQIMQVKGFRQIFVISHDDTFENQTDNVIHVERDHEGSRAIADVGA